MYPLPNNIASLLGSRICHDLVSPIGAISNGVELLQMSDAAAGPELDLISESVQNANARIRFFRITFGMASPDQHIGIKEIRETLDDLTRGTRLRIDWQSDADLGRPEVKLVFLMILCMEAAMPWGGRISVLLDSNRWHVTGSSDRMKDIGPLWDALINPGAAPSLGAAEVQFLLFPYLLLERDRALLLDVSADKITAEF